MRAHVPRDHVSTTSGVRTLRTPVRFLTCVSSLVGGEVVGAREHLSAHATRVRFDARVETHVSGEHVAPGERPLAHLAQVRFGRLLRLLLRLVSRRHVFRETVVQAEHLSANGTDVGHIGAWGHLLNDWGHLELVAHGYGLLCGGGSDVSTYHGDWDQTARQVGCRRGCRRRGKAGRDGWRRCGGHRGQG
jgi:hypothetical protein